MDWVIPGNDDALRAIRLFTSKISDAVVEGRQSYEQSQIAEQKAARAQAGRRGRRVRGHQRLRSLREAGRRFRRRRAGARRRRRRPPPRNRAEARDGTSAFDEWRCLSSRRTRGQLRVRTFRDCVHPTDDVGQADALSRSIKGTEQIMATETGNERIGATREGAARAHRRGIYRVPRGAGRSRTAISSKRSTSCARRGRQPRRKRRSGPRPKAWSAATFTPAEKSACWSKINCESDFVARTEDFQRCATTWPCTSPRSIRAFCGARK